MRRLLKAIVGNLCEEVVLQGRAKLFKELDPILSRKASDCLGKGGNSHTKRILAGASARCKSGRKSRQSRQSRQSRHNNSLQRTPSAGSLGAILNTIGYSRNQRLLFVSHCERGDRYRIIGARKATRKERQQHEEGIREEEAWRAAG